MAAPNSQVRINRWVALLGVTAIMVYLSWKVLEPFVEVLLLGIALAVIFQPIHRKFVAWTGGNRRAAVLSTLFTFVVLVVPFVLVSIKVINELPAVQQAIEQGISGFRKNWEAPAGSNWLTEFKERFHLENLFSDKSIDRFNAELPERAKDILIPVVSGVFGFLLNFVFLMFVLFFLFRDGPKLGSRFIGFLPMPRPQALALAKRTEEVLGACVYGVIMVAAVQGTLGGITFLCLGLPSPVTWGLVMTLFCTLPIVGAWVVWVPAAIGLAIQGDYTRAIVLALVGQFVISTIDGFLRPILVGQRAKLHELVIFFAVLGGLKYFGIIGILLGPVIMSIAWGLTSVLWQSREGVPDTTVTPGENI